MKNLKEFYNTNQNFKDFCDKSLKQGEAASLEALLTHKIVHNVAEYYQQIEREVIPNEQETRLSSNRKTDKVS